MKPGDGRREEESQRAEQRAYTGANLAWPLQCPEPEGSRQERRRILIAACTR